VLRGGAAEQAGLAAGDEWLGLEVGTGKSRSSWRLGKLDDLLLYAGNQERVQALVARDRRLLSLPLKLPRQSTAWRLSAEQREKVQRWLGR